MPIRRLSLTALAALLVLPGSALAQRSAVQPDSARAQIQATLRAFYFNLAHKDWEALTADVLAAKVVAHRPAPESLVRDAQPLRVAVGPWARGDEPASCPPDLAALVDQAILTLDHEWAGVSVPRCVEGQAGADEFRLIRFDGRWRFVYIELFETR
jgi:hypothetical protein